MDSESIETDEQDMEQYSIETNKLYMKSDSKQSKDRICIRIRLWEIHWIWNRIHELETESIETKEFDMVKYSMETNKLDVEYDMIETQQLNLNSDSKQPKNWILTRIQLWEMHWMWNSFHDLESDFIETKKFHLEKSWLKQIIWMWNMIRLYMKSDLKQPNNRIRLWEMYWMWSRIY